MKAIPVIGLGAGGHAKVVIEILRQNSRYELAGLLDPKPEMHGQKILDVPILGNDNLLSQLVSNGIRNFFIGLGSAGNIAPRQKLYELARLYKLCAVNAIHPNAIISPSAVLGNGITIMAGAIINANAILGDNVIVNSGAIVEHDCIIANHVHIATGAKLTGAVHVKTGAHIGAGATIIQNICIGDYAVVGAGAVVVMDIPSHTTVVGIPAKPLHK